MASWKEKGEVPDSDDEWDIESQSNEQDGGVHEPELENPPEVTDDENDIETTSEERIHSQAGAEQSQEYLLQDTTANDEASLLEAYETATTPTNEIAPPFPLFSSSDSNPVFKVPDLEGLSDEEVAAPAVDASPRPSQELPATDDISRSYVRITPPLSTQLSSPPSSLPELLPLPRSKNGTASRSELMETDRASEQHTHENNVQDIENGSNYPMKRALRHRNAIQLHPYVVEQEKYRQTLKSRGIAPMRLASSQVEARHAPRNSSSPDPDFQEQETQEVEADTGESQAMELDWDPPPSSSLVRPVGIRNENGIDHEDEYQDDQEDDLPDLDELRSRHQTSGKTEPKRRRIKSYSHKFKRPVLPRILTQPSKVFQTTDSHIFDGPASPPATSSPFLNAIPSGRLGTSRGESRSLEPTPSLLSQDEMRVQKSVELPTPVTSAIKPPLEPISLDSESESDDPFASDVEKSNASSSSHESVQIRKISKKIRGVLPASHLRLDQKKKLQPISRTNRDSRSASPAKTMPRRGVALPRTLSGILGQQRSPLAAASTGFPFFSDDSDEDDENGLIMEDNPASHLESLFPESRMGFAEEEDKIDAMLPSRKRQSTTSSRPSKRRKTGSSAFLQTGTGTHRRQPKITDHLGQAPRASSGVRSKSHSRHKRKGRKDASLPRKPSPPALGILDVTDDFAGNQGTSPDFIRIAARAARARSAQGRHKPSGKFFRLSTCEDTEDVQSVLQDWTAGKLQPKKLSEFSKHRVRTVRGPLSQIQNNQQTHFERPISKARPAMEINPLGSSRKGRRLLASRRQQSINDFITKDQMPQDSTKASVLYKPSHNIDLSVRKRSRFQHHSARPAQLEGSENEYSHRYPSTTFKSSKRALDALYRGTRKRPIPLANLQLSRFLADEDIVQPSIEIHSSRDCEVSEVTTNHSAKHQRAQKLGRQKQRPRRVDIGAAIYRQPSHPLILDSFAAEAAADASSSTLLGLAKFGTRYTQHFDILPLPPGVFFHANTFIGSGRLSEVVRNLRVKPPSPTPIVVSLNLAKTFSWGSWDENVSSEVGLCFDWLVGQLELNRSLPSSSSSAAATDVVTSVLEYTQKMTFSGTMNEIMFLSRMLEVLRDFSSRLKVSHITKHADVQKGIQVMSRMCTLTFLLLSVARTKQDYVALTFDFEDLLKGIARQCSQLLLSQDLSVLRKLYDDLQYLSFRDSGIRCDHYAAEAWVILIQVLCAAKIPRGSFWDVVGPLLTAVDVAKVIDAPSMEKIWYSMYTLLPLCEFDEHGVVIQDARQLASFDNWQLPQQMLKQIFSLYKTNPRQSPGFNDYCGSIVSRCHYLMVEWGWWKCSAVIGTLFDFFASQNLAHLRNEEVYTSPHFLEELDQNPSLAVEPEDRCFHVFLKIVALALKQFSRVGDVKSIRNLVARLLPNHDRQYPKHEAIHQKDLASLRNHHDLLCALFWASPPAQRPSLAAIENLVERGDSHKEAFLVHLQAHTNLARFVFSSNQDMEIYTQMGDWSAKSLDSLFSQHSGESEEVRKHAVEGVTEADISEIIASNKAQIEYQILKSLVGWVDQIGVAVSGENAKKALHPELLAKAIDFARCNECSLTNGILRKCLEIVDKYVEKIEQLRPSIAQQKQVIASGAAESQDSLDDVDMELMEYMASMVAPFRNLGITGICGNLSRLVFDYLEGRLEGPTTTALHLVCTWARLASLAVNASGVFQNLKDYLLVFKLRKSRKLARDYWPLFLANVARDCPGFADMKLSGFDLQHEWLLVLANPNPVADFVRDLTFQMIARYAYLKHPCMGEYLGSNHSQTLNLKSAISCMRTALLEGTTELNFGLSDEEARRMFSKMIDAVQESMRDNLASLEPGSEEHGRYLHIVWEVIAHIKAFGSGFLTVSEFFTKSSASYWPDQTDPKMFVATLTSYCLDLEQKNKKTCAELFYFLHHTWIAQLEAGQINDFCRRVNSCLNQWSFLEFMLAEYLPIAVESAFAFKNWPALHHFFIAAIGPIMYTLRDAIKNGHLSTTVAAQNEAAERAAWVFGKVLDLFKIAMNHVSIPGYSQASLALMLNFWRHIDYDMMVYVNEHLDQKNSLEFVLMWLSEVVRSYRSKPAFLVHRSFEIQSSEFLARKDFARVMYKSVPHAAYDGTDGYKLAVFNTRRAENSTAVLLPFKLEDIMENATILGLLAMKAPAQ